MAAGEADENVFEAGLPGGEMQQLGLLLRDSFEQRRNGYMRLAHGERDESIIGASGFDAGEGTPGLETVVAGRDREFDDVLAAESLDQVGRRPFGDGLAVVDDGEAIAEALGFVHVMCGE